MNMLSHPCRVQPLFELGRIVITPGALEACTAVFLQRCLARHVTGDWGCVCRQDALQNWPSTTEGCLFSAYVIDRSKPSTGYGENTLWIKTSADRSVTTLHLPREK
jgi:hypothetical protein